MIQGLRQHGGGLGVFEGLGGRQLGSKAQSPVILADEKAVHHSLTAVTCHTSRVSGRLNRATELGDALLPTDDRGC